MKNAGILNDLAETKPQKLISPSPKNNPFYSTIEYALCRFTDEIIIINVYCQKQGNDKQESGFNRVRTKLS